MNSTQSHITELLAPGQILGDPFPREPGGIMDRFGYNAYPVQPSASNGNANSVVLEIEPGGTTEYIHVLGDIAMHVRAIGGQGELVIYGADGQRRIHSLAPDVGSVAIGQGDTYQYLHIEGWRQPLLVLDTCRPVFALGDEISLDKITAEQGLESGSRLLLWSPREPKEAHLAGVWHLAVGDHHDTSTYNRDRSDLRGFRGEPSHWHGDIRRVGNSELMAVNVRLLDGVYVVDHRRQPGVTTPYSDAQIQPHATIFKQITD